MSTEQTSTGSAEPQTKRSNRNRKGKNFRAKQQSKTSWADMTEREQAYEDRPRATPTLMRTPGARDIEPTFKPGTYPQIINIGVGEPRTTVTYEPDPKYCEQYQRAAWDLLENQPRFREYLSELPSTSAERITQLRTCTAIIGGATRIAQAHRAVGNTETRISGRLSRTQNPQPRTLATIIGQLGEFNESIDGRKYRLRDVDATLNHWMRAAYLVSKLPSPDPAKISQILALHWLPYQEKDGSTNAVLATYLSEWTSAKVKDVIARPKDLFSGSKPAWWSLFQQQLPEAIREKFDWLYAIEPLGQVQWATKLKETPWEVIGLLDTGQIPESFAAFLCWKQELRDPCSHIIGEWLDLMSGAYRYIHVLNIAAVFMDMPGSRMQHATQEKKDEVTNLRFHLEDSPANMSLAFAAPLPAKIGLAEDRGAVMATIVDLVLLLRNWITDDLVK